MATHDATRRGGIPPITVRPGVALAATVVTVLLGALTLPATVPDRPGFAYFSGGLIGAVLLAGILLGADLRRARAARRAGLTVLGITLGAFGSRLMLAAPPDAPQPTGWSPTMPDDAVRVEAKLARAGLSTTGLAGALLIVLGSLAPGGTVALAAQVALWVGTFALLMTFCEALPTPRSAGGRLIAARVLHRTGSREQADRAVARAGVISGWSLIIIGAVGLFVVGLVALWATLLGWLALGASRLSQSQQRTAAALTGLTARDAMTPAPPPVSSWSTVDDALDEVVLPARCSVFGVVAFDGSLAGVVLLRDLADVPMDDRTIARVNRIVVPLDQVAVAEPDDPLAELPARLIERPGAGCVVIVDRSGADGLPRMIGTVGPVEFSQAIESAPLRGRRPARPSRTWR